mmetsp:Transcript_14456/g.60905  ORF Transcript_14456/g.60905 Transcript_14456/m.60905 type:complete len:214 (-) Transcript_14456:492-1133(-)
MSGVTMRGSSASARPARSHMRPSSSKSSSRVSRSANSGTRNVKSKFGNATVMAEVMSRIVARSTSNCLRRPGLCTFTATSSPFAVTARCTCASDAAAIGSRSKNENTVEEHEAGGALDAFEAKFIPSSVEAEYATTPSVFVAAGGLAAPAPNASSTTLCTSSNGRGVALSCSFESSRWNGTGIPEAVPMNWPALVYRPPLRSHSRNRRAAARS